MRGDRPAEKQKSPLPTMREAVSVAEEQKGDRSDETWFMHLRGPEREEVNFAEEVVKRFESCDTPRLFAYKVIARLAELLDEMELENDNLRGRPEGK